MRLVIVGNVLSRLSYTDKECMTNVTRYFHGQICYRTQTHLLSSHLTKTPHVKHLTLLNEYLLSSIGAYLHRLCQTLYVTQTILVSLIPYPDTPCQIPYLYIFFPSTYPDVACLVSYPKTSSDRYLTETPMIRLKINLPKHSFLGCELTQNLPSLRPVTIQKHIT